MKKIIIGLILIVALLATACSESSNTTTTQASAGLDATTLPAATTTSIMTTTSLTTTTIANPLDTLKNDAIRVPYDDLFRNNQNYIGKPVVYTGEVIQVMGSSGNWELRVNVDKEGEGGFELWSNTVYVTYAGTERFLEGDIIKFYGTVKGVMSYTAVLGNTIEIPQVESFEINLIEKAGDRVTTSQPTSDKFTIGPSPYPIKEGMKTYTKEGVTIGLIDYTFEKKGDDWGKLKSIRIFIDNNGADTLFPTVLVKIYDSSVDKDKIPSKVYDIGGILSTSKYMEVNLDTDLSFDKISNEKEVTIAVGDGVSYFKGRVFLTVPIKFES